MPNPKPDFDVLVVGAGFAGLYMLHRLRGLGLTARVHEAGSDVGGTWFWNRYPGARCDVESLQYSYSFDDALQQDWEWTERYPSQAEILRYINHVADRFDLRRDIVLNSTVAATRYDAVQNLWHLATADGTTATARFVVMATGCLSAARVPDMPGLASFKGRHFHTGTWPLEPIDFAGEIVGVIGTGSSGIQAIPVIARQAKHVYVFQRTPNFSVPAWNAPMPAETQAEWKAHYAEHRARARNTRSGILYQYSDRATAEATPEERQREYAARWQRGGANFTHAFNDIFTDKSANDQLADYVRAQIRAIVQDPVTAATLCPTDHAIGTKRICVDTDYYATFNRPNVTLVNLRETPIETITPSGIRTSAGEAALDSIVFATGYDAVTGALNRIDIAGEGGQRLSDKWAAGPRCYLGLMATGFPNLFMVTGPGSPSVFTNVIVSIEQHVDWIADCLATLRARGAARITVQPDAEEAWVSHVNEIADKTLFPTAASWYVGANIPGKPRVFLPYVGGFQNYSRICEEIVADDYRGFRIEPAAWNRAPPRRGELS